MQGLHKGTLRLHYTTVQLEASAHFPVTWQDSCAVMVPHPREFRDSAKQMGSAVKFIIHLLQTNLGERTTCKKKQLINILHVDID